MLQPKGTEINNEKSILKIIDGGIIHILYKKGSLLEVEDMERVKEGLTLLSGSNLSAFKTLIELQEFVTITHEARLYGAEHSPKTVAAAFVFIGLPQRMLVKFYLKMLNTDKPTKAFNTYHEALDWLKNYDPIV